MNKKISLKDIAQQVGVSAALVSYVLNNQKEGRINKEVAQKIRDTAKALNYRTNQVAKSLKTNKTFTIGLIVADIANPFSSGLARIIEDEADKLQYTVIFGSSDENAQKFGKLLDTFLNRQVDGLIIAPPDNSDEQILYLQQQDIPFVLIDRYVPGITTNYVALDNYTAAYNATEHMIINGCRQPGMVTYDTSLFHILERTRGFIAALKFYKMPFKKRWLKRVAISNPKAAIEKAVLDLMELEQPVDGILFGSNSITEHAVKLINTLPLKVPKDLSIVSFDETESLDLFYAPLTYMRQPLQEMGREATKILLEVIGKNNKITQVNLKAELVVKASSVKV